MTPIFRAESVIFDLKKYNFSCLTSRMAINIYKEKNIRKKILGLITSKNEKYFILIFRLFTRKIGIKN